MSISDPDISVIIVSWNVRELLRANLQRLLSLNSPYRSEIFVVDNDSHDGTAYMVRNEFPGVHLITNNWDAGFAGPNNQALRLAKGKVVILLNPDMLVEEGALEKTYDKLMTEKDIGVLGIKLLNKEGQPIGSVRRYPDFLSQLAVILKIGHLFPKVLDHYLYKEFDYATSQDVDQVRGSFFAFRRELLDTVGYLDAGYHIWFEEVDYCLRAKQHGLRIHYFADAVARDYVGKGVAQMKHLEKQRIFTASMVRYFKKWKPWWQTSLLIAARPFGLLAALMMDVKKSVTK